MRKPILAVTTAVIAASVLASCAATGTAPVAEIPTSPSPTPTPSATAALSAQPTTEPATEPTTDSTVEPVPATAPATILIGPEAVGIVDAAGSSLLSLPYTGDGDAAVAAVTAVLGTPTDTQREEMSPHYPAAEATIWDGFTVVVNQFDELDEPPTPSNYVTNFYVIADAVHTASGVSIATLDGTQVGASYAETVAGKSVNEVFDDETFGMDAVTIDLPTSFSGIVPDGDIPMSWGVIGTTNEGSSTIDSIFAPQYLRSLA